MYRIHLSILTLSLCSALQISPVERNADNICIRNDGKPGYFVHFRNCSLISSMIERKKQGIPLTSDEQDYMRNSGCAVYRRGHVCCESEDKVAQGILELSSHDCGKFATKKTIGGREINLMSRPWMALLKFRTRFDTEEFTCGGTLIHKNWILTAAHCFNNQILLSVRLGEHNTTSETDCEHLRGQDIYAPPVENFEIDRVFLHEQYSTRSAHNDIALVKLKSEAKITSKGHVCCESEDKVVQGIRELSSHDCGTIGGHKINLMLRPWMALLKFRTRFDTEEFTCGGTLIHKNWILTAAHCFNNQILLSVRLGEHNTTSETDCVRRRGRDICAPPVENFEIDRVFLHEQYSTGSAHNDIALVKLKSEAKITESIRPICLPVNETIQRNVETLERFYIAGWGKTENETSSEVPLETIVTARKRSSCQASFTREIVPTQICAGDRGRDSCNGDSGGPLVFVDVFKGQQRFVQFGIVSFGSSTCGDGNPGVYTNVGSYTPWIAYKIATNASSSVMENRSAPILPTYAESCATSSDLKKNSLCQTLFAYNTLKEPDPVIILITLAVVIGSFCLLSGFFLLCVVSKAWQDETSEAILLMGIGFFITSLSCVTWKLTNAQRLAQLQETISI
ncbi:hypothetical protein ACLKA6_008770 [Drosophila palustris]